MKSFFKIIGSLTTIGLLFTACQNAPQKTEKPAAASEGNQDIVCLSPKQEATIGIRLGQVKKRSMSTSLRVTGKLQLAPQYRAKVSAFIGGNIKAIYVKEGNYVKKGQVLAVLANPKYIDLQQHYQELHSSLRFLKNEYRRKKTLYQHEVASAKAYQKALSAYRRAKVQYKGLEQKLHLLGFSPTAVKNGHVSATAPITSPINGFVHEININTGQFVGAQNSLFTISNNAHVHADFKVYERDFPSVKKGQVLLFSVGNHPDKTIKARVNSIGQNLEEDTRAIHIHAKIITPDIHLLPGLFITGKLQTGISMLDALPKEALISRENKHFIFIQSKSTQNQPCYKMIPLKTGIQDENFIAVNWPDSLSKDTKVVVKGSYYIEADKHKEEFEED